MSAEESGDSIKLLQSADLGGHFMRLENESRTHQPSPGGIPAGSRRVRGVHSNPAIEGADTVPGDNFGYSVAVSGSTVVVGAPYSGGVTGGGSAGRAYVFTKAANGWHQSAELTGPAPTQRATSQLCMLPGDEFGNSVAVSGETVVVGACGQAMAGRAYVFTNGANGWHQTAELKGSDTARGDGFGWSVALSGGTVVVGAPGHARRAGRVSTRARLRGPRCGRPGRHLSTQWSRVPT